MQAEFQAYASIQNHYRDKYIKYSKEKNPAAFEGKWMIQEKIHGANFSVVLFQGGLRYGRRNGFLTGLIPYKLDQKDLQKYEKYFSQKFYNAHTLFVQKHNQIAPLFGLLKEQFPGLSLVNIYGQLFGGTLNGKNTGAKAVQLQVEYSPNIQFLIFDILVTCEKGQFFVDPSSLEKLTNGVLKMVPILKVCDFDQAMQYQTKFNSMIPEFLGHKKQGDNISEGIVIRPIMQASAIADQKIIIKKKNAEFKEVAAKPKQKKVQATKLTAEQQQLFDQISPYNTKIRVASVLSKKDTKDLNQISRMMVEDMWADFQKDGHKKKVEPGKEFNNLLKKQVIETIKQHNQGK